MPVAVDVKVGAEILLRSLREALAKDLVGHIRRSELRAAELARLAATSEMTVSDLLDGDVPSLDVLLRVAVAMGVDVRVTAMTSTAQMVCEVE